MSARLSPELEAHFQHYVKMGSTPEALAELILGDASYERKFRFPKRSVPVIESFTAE